MLPSRAIALNTRTMQTLIPSEDIQRRVRELAQEIRATHSGDLHLVCVLKEEVKPEQVNQAFKAASESERLHGILEYTEDPIVSSDIVGNPHSCIFDSLSTMAIGNLVKVIGWYDNEWGFSNRMVDLLGLVGSSL